MVQEFERLEGTTGFGVDDILMVLFSPFFLLLCVRERIEEKTEEE